MLVLDHQKVLHHGRMAGLVKVLLGDEGRGRKQLQALSHGLTGISFNGTLARWVEERSGANGAGLGSGIVLAWAIAASTPLFNA